MSVRSRGSITITSRFCDPSEIVVTWLILSKWFAAKGSRSNNIYVHPGLDTVVVRNSLYTRIGNSNSREDGSYHSTEFPADWDDNEFFTLVIESVN